ncbi:Protein of unknown function [Leifsonia sp. CL147]|nr:Protein of unknown function [Leifsonia sp. CL154]SFL86184.1 Protein of unknown function [Leifsonia sp. CL147]
MRNKTLSLSAAAVLCALTIGTLAGCGAVASFTVDGVSIPEGKATVKTKGAASEIVDSGATVHAKANAPVALTLNKANANVICDDSTSEIDIQGLGGTVSVSGACNVVNISGFGATVNLGAVQDITLEGASNTVDVDSAETLSVAGVSNKVTYGKVTTIGRVEGIDNRTRVR